jgi:hypothetical protein
LKNIWKENVFESNAIADLFFSCNDTGIWFEFIIVCEDEIPIDFEIETVNLTGTWDVSGEQWCLPGGYKRTSESGRIITEQTGKSSEVMGMMRPHLRVLLM